MRKSIITIVFFGIGLILLIYSSIYCYNEKTNYQLLKEIIYNTIEKTDKVNSITANYEQYYEYDNVIVKKSLNTSKFDMENKISETNYFDYNNNIEQSSYQYKKDNYTYTTSDKLNYKKTNIEWDKSDIKTVLMSYTSYQKFIDTILGNYASVFTVKINKNGTKQFDFYMNDNEIPSLWNTLIAMLSIREGITIKENKLSDIFIKNISIKVDCDSNNVLKKIYLSVNLYGNESNNNKISHEIGYKMILTYYDVNSTIVELPDFNSKKVKIVEEYRNMFNDLYVGKWKFDKVIKKENRLMKLYTKVFDIESIDKEIKIIYYELDVNGNKIDNSEVELYGKQEKSSVFIYESNGHKKIGELIYLGSEIGIFKILSSNGYEGIYSLTF